EGQAPHSTIESHTHEYPRNLLGANAMIMFGDLPVNPRGTARRPKGTRTGCARQVKTRRSRPVTREVSRSPRPMGTATPQLGDARREQPIRNEFSRLTLRRAVRIGPRRRKSHLKLTRAYTLVKSTQAVP